MKSVMEQTGLLIEAIKESNEYSQYQILLEKVMREEGVYQRMNDFRRRNFVLQLNPQMDALDASAGLVAEYEDVLGRTDVKEFLAAEQRYVKMIRKMNQKIEESLQINIDFLEG